MKLLIVLLIFLSLFSQIALAQPTWWNQNWHFRFNVTIENNVTLNRTNYPVDMGINFTEKIGQLNYSNYIFDNNSIRLLEYSNFSDNGSNVSSELPVEFIPSVSFNNLTNSAGSLVWFVNITNNTKRYYYIYFDVMPFNKSFQSYSTDLVYNGSSVLNSFVNLTFGNGIVPSGLYSLYNRLNSSQYFSDDPDYASWQYFQTAVYTPPADYSYSHLGDCIITENRNFRARIRCGWDYFPTIGERLYHDFTFYAHNQWVKVNVSFGINGSYQPSTVWAYPFVSQMTSGFGSTLSINDTTNRIYAINNSNSSYAYWIDNVTGNAYNLDITYTGTARLFRVNATPTLTCPSYPCIASYAKAALIAGSDNATTYNIGLSLNTPVNMTVGNSEASTRFFGFTPVNNTYTTNTWLAVNVTTSFNYGSGALFELNGLSNESMTNSSLKNFYINKTGLTGSNNYRVFVNDTNNRFYVTETRKATLNFSPTTPSVTLSSPADLATNYGPSTLIYYTPSDSIEFSSCSLYTNSTGSWSPFYSSTNVGNGQNNTLPLSLPNGNYLWNVQCCNAFGTCSSGSQNRTLTFSASNLTDNFNDASLNTTLWSAKEVPPLSNNTSVMTNITLAEQNQRFEINTTASNDAAILRSLNSYDYYKLDFLMSIQSVKDQSYFSIVDGEWPPTVAGSIVFYSHSKIQLVYLSRFNDKGFAIRYFDANNSRFYWDFVNNRWNNYLIEADSTYYYPFNTYLNVSVTKNITHYEITLRNSTGSLIATAPIEISKVNLNNNSDYFVWGDFETNFNYVDMFVKNITITHSNFASKSYANITTGNSFFDEVIQQNLDQLIARQYSTGPIQGSNPRWDFLYDDGFFPRTFSIYTYTFFNYTGLAKRALQFLFDNRRNDGLIRVCTKPDGTICNALSENDDNGYFLWQAYFYVKKTNDTAFLNQNWENIVNVSDYLVSKINTNYNLTIGDSEGWPSDKLNYYDMRVASWTYRGLKSAALLAGLESNTTKQSQWDGNASLMIDGIDNKLWNGTYYAAALEGSGVRNMTVNSLQLAPIFGADVPVSDSKMEATVNVFVNTTLDRYSTSTQKAFLPYDISLGPTPAGVGVWYWPTIFIADYYLKRGNITEAQYIINGIFNWTASQNSTNRLVPEHVNTNQTGIIPSFKLYPTPDYVVDEGDDEPSSAFLYLVESMVGLDSDDSTGFILYPKTPLNITSLNILNLQTQQGVVSYNFSTNYNNLSSIIVSAPTHTNFSTVLPISNTLSDTSIVVTRNGDIYTSWSSFSKGELKFVNVTGIIAMSSVNITVSLASETPGGGIIFGGGVVGGGGGGGRPSLPITTNMSDVIIVYKNEPQQFSIVLNNTANFSVFDLSINVSGIPNSWYSINPDFIKIFPAESMQNILLSLDPIDLGNYTFNFTIGTPFVRNTKEVRLVVLQREQISIENTVPACYIFGIPCWIVVAMTESILIAISTIYNKKLHNKYAKKLKL